MFGGEHISDHIERFVYESGNEKWVITDPDDNRVIVLKKTSDGKWLYKTHEHGEVEVSQDQIMEVLYKYGVSLMDHMFSNDQTERELAKKIVEDYD